VTPGEDGSLQPIKPEDPVEYDPGTKTFTLDSTDASLEETIKDYCI
jgi:hypothetical protein